MNALAQELGVKLKLVQIPREIMEKNRKSPPPFLEVAVLIAEPVYRSPLAPFNKGRTGSEVPLAKGDLGGSQRTVDIARYTYPTPSKYTACIKVGDTFGCDTSITVEVEV